MARNPRFSRGGLAYHVMNRAAGNIELFQDAEDYQAFEMAPAAYRLMPNHSRLVLWPARLILIRGRLCPSC